MKVFGLVGFPLGHSFSKAYFAKKFEDENIHARYENFPIESLDKLAEIFEKNPSLNGLNVTIPYKEKIIPYLHNMEPEARKIGAINTIRVERIFGNIQLTGFNTDVTGFEESLAPLLRDDHKQALVIGSGGASRSVCYVLEKLSISWKIISREPRNIQMISYDNLSKEIIQQHKLIINTTPIGMYPSIGECPAIPYEGISSKHLLYDLVYNPENTLFMKKGRDKGASVKNGLEMLKIQAEKAWEIWNAL